MKNKYKVAGPGLLVSDYDPEDIIDRLKGIVCDSKNNIIAWCYDKNTARKIVEALNNEE